MPTSNETDDVIDMGANWTMQTVHIHPSATQVNTEWLAKDTVHS